MGALEEVVLEHVSEPGSPRALGGDVHLIKDSSSHSARMVRPLQHENAHTVVEHPFFHIEPGRVERRCLRNEPLGQKQWRK
jgi:hypothetical protein